MGSQRKINGNGEEISSLLSLRDELFSNTLQIIELVRERLKLAEEIGREKEALGMSPRNREREMEVIRSIPGLGDIEKSVLNMIFELTILNEVKEKPQVSLVKDAVRRNREMVLSGPDELLSYSMGLIVSFPGFELRDRIGVPENLALGVIQRGGHITSLTSGKRAGNVTLADLNGTVMASVIDGTLTLSSNLFSMESKNDLLEAI